MFLRPPRQLVSLFSLPLPRAPQPSAPATHRSEQSQLQAVTPAASPVTSAEEPLCRDGAPELSPFYFRSAGPSPPSRNQGKGKGVGSSGGLRPFSIL